VISTSEDEELERIRAKKLKEMLEKRRKTENRGCNHVDILIL